MATAIRIEVASGELGSGELRIRIEVPPTNSGQERVRHQTVRGPEVSSDGG